MNYHNITHDDMNNGEGLRVVLWVAGCDHHCHGCQNPLTWNPDDGLHFLADAMKEIEADLRKDYVAGVTFSGGDPLHPKNVQVVGNLAAWFKEHYPDKTIWLYTGYTWDEIIFDINGKLSIMEYIDVLVDGPFVEALKDVNYPWAGSTNQRVIDVQKTLKEGKVILYDGHKEGRHT